MVKGESAFYSHIVINHNHVIIYTDYNPLFNVLS